MLNFSWQEIYPGVIQIRDCMGVCMTLLKGSERAILIDTGYGMEDVAPLRSERKKHGGSVLIASGSDGISYSHDGGHSWQDITDSLPEGVKGYHALSSTGKVIWAAGSHGHIGRIHN